AQNETLVTGQAVDFETHEAIAETKISIVLQQAETYSGADGNFSLAIPVPGEITIKAEKQGYTLWEEDLIIGQGESMTVLVEMEKGE
ncbi:MAG: carboxypeptidase-like regulatory domain-containing protein, partial [Lutibacter sp.]